METISKIKTTALRVIFVSSVIFGAASCEKKDTDHKTSGTGVTGDLAKDQNDGKFNKSKDEQNAMFLVKAAEINLEEIRLGQLAQKKSTHTSIKNLGKMMESAHLKAMGGLEELAAKKTISVPTEEDQEAKNTYAKLNAKSEKDFDKDYVDMMVDGHKHAIALFEKEAAESSDEDIRVWATSMLPELRKHLDHAIVVQKECEKL
jgi:putative membrane protein